MILIVALVVSGCTSDPDASVAGGSVIAVPVEEVSTAAQDALAGSSAGIYELEVSTRGGSQRRRLHRPVPVGTTEMVEVVISGPDGTLSAVMSVVVETSMADGSSQTLLLTIDRIGASDEATDQTLQRAIGSSLRTTTDEALIVVEREATIPGDLPDDQRFWVERLLEAPVTFAGPIPLATVGEGAAWTFEVHDVREQRAVTFIDGERSVVTVTDDDGQSVGVVEAEYGRVIPTRQEMTVGEWTTVISTIG